MLHVRQLRLNATSPEIDAFIKKASGRYYTGELVGKRLAAVVAENLARQCPNNCLRIIDPFGGDGRLVEWLISAWCDQGHAPVRWNVTIIDVDDVGFVSCQERINRLTASGTDIELNLLTSDAFVTTQRLEAGYDAVITNPPWELLKPDRREISGLPHDQQKAYVAHMRDYDNWLSKQYPLSQPKRKFAGWGTNLSRVGLEVSLLLARSKGIVGVVLPASILADEQSLVLRKHLLTEHALLDVAYFPAEQKHYDAADVESVTIVAEANGSPQKQVPFYSHRLGGSNVMSALRLDEKSMKAVDYVLPISFGADTIEIHRRIASRLPRWQDLENAGTFWSGREIDETGSSTWLRDSDERSVLFIKGRMIDRFLISTTPTKKVDRERWSPPISCQVPRIVWRDVSRPNQKRRMIATIIPAGWVAGNSLGVACFKDGNEIALRSLLGVMTSTTFELQLRGYLATGHISLGSLRKVALPSEADLRADTTLAHIVQRRLGGDEGAEVEADAYVAHSIYGLSRIEYSDVLKQFVKLSEAERAELICAYDRQTDDSLRPATDKNSEVKMTSRGVLVETSPKENQEQRIANHRSARLSEVDMQMVRSIPEGGNWKDIPKSIPSKRLEQIRESFLRGKGAVRHIMDD